AVTISVRRFRIGSPAIAYLERSFVRGAMFEVVQQRLRISSANRAVLAHAISSRRRSPRFIAPAISAVSIEHGPTCIENGWRARSMNLRMCRRCSCSFVYRRKSDGRHSTWKHVYPSYGVDDGGRGGPAVGAI